MHVNSSGAGHTDIGDAMPLEGQSPQDLTLTDRCYRDGAALMKLAASFVLPVPLYFATRG